MKNSIQIKPLFLVLLFLQLVVVSCSQSKKQDGGKKQLIVFFTGDHE
jgi:hypothetical protein